jgi:hypothetical protein
MTWEGSRCVVCRESLARTHGLLFDALGDKSTCDQCRKLEAMSHTSHRAGVSKETIEGKECKTLTEIIQDVGDENLFNEHHIDIRGGSATQTHPYTQTRTRTSDTETQTDTVRPPPKIEPNHKRTNFLQSRQNHM